MKTAVVADSTCLIGLERIDRLDLVPARFGVVLAPPGVRREFGVSLGWLTIQAPRNIALVTVLSLHQCWNDHRAALPNPYGLSHDGLPRPNAGISGSDRRETPPTPPPGPGPFPRLAVVGGGAGVRLE